MAEIGLGAVDVYSRSQNPYQQAMQAEQQQAMAKEIQESQESKQKVVEVQDAGDAHVQHQSASTKGMKTLFRWGQSKDGNFHIKPSEKSFIKTPMKVEKGQEFSMRFLGYKVDMSSKVSEFKSLYQKYFIDARSHNALFSAFAKVKFSAVQAALSVLGISTEVLKELQKKALNHAMEENEVLFEQNEYNMEMLQLFGSGKKDRAKRKVLEELRDQLKSQMSRYGRPEFYNEERLLGIQKGQVQKILQELSQEYHNLEYVRDYQ